MEKTDGLGAAMPETELTTQPDLPTTTATAFTTVPQPALAPTPAAPAAAPATAPLPRPTPADTLFALVLAVAGFLFWECELPQRGADGVGATIFFLLLLAASLIYLRFRSIRQNRRSLVLLAFAVLGALPFVLNGWRSINDLLFVFECSLCLMWVAYSCRATITAWLSGFLFGDLLNQFLLVPFAHAILFFTRPFAALTSKFKDSSRAVRTLASIILVLLVFLPVLLLVISFLANSDDGFNQLVRNLTVDLNLEKLFDWSVSFVLGLPIAALVFGAVFGNATKLRTRHLLNHEQLSHGLGKIRRIPCAAFYLPLGLLTVVYLAYFVAMGTYLFSALGGELPQAYTYAQYARQGFFELCSVAIIDLGVLATVWLLARRDERGDGQGGERGGEQGDEQGSEPHNDRGSERHNKRRYPALLRLLGGLLALLTVLLVITAASKMALYVQTYGLTELRLYTSWFMLLLLISFTLLAIWHLKAFNVARPLIIIATVMTLILGLTNTSGLIASYNVEAYLSGQTQEIDITAIRELGDAARPALERLHAEARDMNVSSEASRLLGWLNAHLKPFASPSERLHWYSWNFQVLTYSQQP